MERIVYIKTLDVHKNGIQFTLQGFETADKMARRIELCLMASGDTIDLPLEQMVAMAYVTTPSATEPSINECIIKDNTIIYDVLPITEEGITEIKIKLIDTRVKGANGVLAAPTFAVEVTESGMNDESVTQTATYTALENAIAKANGVYAARLVGIELDSDCMFRARYADGTVYESDVLKELFLKGDALLSQSYARGGTGIRAGEDTDNSKYYSNVSKSASAEALDSSEKSVEILEEVRKHGVYTAFSVDFESGEMKYISPTYAFNVNKENGELDVIGKAYNPDETIDLLVTEWLNTKSASIDHSAEKVAELEAALTAESTRRDVADTLLAQDIEAESLARVNDIDGLRRQCNDIISAFANMHQESEGFPGCYYRVVNGVTEWINPPMVHNEEYLTTERHNGIPVYVKRFIFNDEVIAAGGEFIMAPLLKETSISILDVTGVYRNQDALYKKIEFASPSAEVDCVYGTVSNSNGGSIGLTNKSTTQTVNDLIITVKFIDDDYRTPGPSVE